MPRFLALCLALCLAAPCFAQPPATGDGETPGLLEGRVHPSAELMARAVSMNNFDFTTSTEDHDDSVFLRGRAALDALLSDRMVARIQYQGFATGGERQIRITPKRNDADLREAWLDATLAGPNTLSLRAGRQLLSYGDERVIGTNSWHPIGAAFDGLALSWRPAPAWRLDALALRVGDFAYSKDLKSDGDAYAFGLMGDVRPLSGTDIAPYWIWQDYDADARADYLPSLDAGGGGLSAHTIGGRATQRLLPGLVQGLALDAEANFQTGHAGDKSLSGYLLHAGLSLADPLPHVASLSLGWDRYSGDDSPSDSRVATYQPVFPSTYRHTGLIAWFGMQNLDVLRLGVSGDAPWDLAWQADAYDFTAVTTKDAIYLANREPTALTDRGVASRDLGRELDLRLSREFFGLFTLAATGSLLWPGEYMRESLSRRGVESDWNTMFTLTLEAKL